MGKSIGMVAIISGGIIYLLKIKKQTQQETLEYLNGKMKEIPSSKIRKIFPELKEYDIIESDNYYINTSRKILFVPNNPKKLLVAHEAGHAILKKGKILRKLLDSIKYVYYPVSEENQAWEYAKSYAGRNEDVEKIKKPFIRSYKISIITKAAITVVSAVVTMFVIGKYNKDGEKDER